MSTRSYIAKEQEDGTFRYIYCHFDGYLDGVGRTLVDHFRSRNKTDELIELGSLSYLGSNIDEPNDSDNPNPDRSITVAYHRDRDEDLKINRAENLEELLTDFKNSWCNYIYLYPYDNHEQNDTKSKWLVKNDSDDFWMAVSDRL